LVVHIDLVPQVILTPFDIAIVGSQLDMDHFSYPEVLIDLDLLPRIPSTRSPDPVSPTFDPNAIKDNRSNKEGVRN
jgi:hypothetical protein